MENFCTRGQREIRKASDLQAVLFDQSFKNNFVVYEVCRKEEEKGVLERDLTLIHPTLLGRELPKTFGHYHENQEAELYEVIFGKALFLMQKYGGNPLIIQEAYLIEAGPNEMVVIPPVFSMTTINPELNQELLAGNWVSANIQNDYELFRKTRGASYYVLAGENGKIILEKNPNYQKVPELVRLRPKPLARELKVLEFLADPSNYQKILTIENLYHKI
jgi:glucose-6-phosphate isomerase